MHDELINNKEKRIIGTSLIKCLTECEKGEEVVVLRVNAGQNAKTRLANLGVVPGVKITKTKNAPFKGPLEIIVKGSSLVIGRGLASKIIVECNETCLT
ncbi:MAG TPA: FeoA family protein [Candidatus Nanopelagicaceae bacterium]|jgi:DtxR family Mn-dependent transcriptional regulator|nr:FeoA family protein [Candidatus Nanopelagicaceae bacterium]